MNFLAAFGAPAARPAAQPRPVPTTAEDRDVLAWVARLGWEERHMVRRLLQVASWRPDAQGQVLAYLNRYAQARYMLAAG